MIILDSCKTKSENKRFFIKAAMEKIISDKSSPFILLIDEDNNYTNFLKKYNYIIIDIFDINEDEIREKLESNPDLFLLNIKYPVEYCLNEIKKIEKIVDKSGRISMLIYDSNDIHKASFVIDEYNNLEI